MIYHRGTCLRISITRTLFVLVGGRSGTKPVPAPPLIKSSSKARDYDYLVKYNNLQNILLKIYRGTRAYEYLKKLSKHVSCEFDKFRVGT